MIRKILKKRWLLLIPLAFIFSTLVVYFVGRHVVTPLNPTLVTPIAHSQLIGLKILIQGRGIYEVTQKQLEGAGFVVEEADLLHIRLYHRGQRQPLFIQKLDNNTYTLQFFAPESDSLYSLEDVYILKREGEVDGFTTFLKPEESTHTGSNIENNSYLAISHLEENTIYFPQVKEGDHWLWNALPVGQKSEYQVEISNIAPGPGHIKVRIWSGTETTTAPDHHICVDINGVNIIDAKWDGMGSHILEGEISDGLFVKGKNNLLIVTTGDTGAVAENNDLDWIEVQYPRYPLAEVDYLEFTGAGKDLLIRGFTGAVAIFDVTEPDNTVNVGNYSTSKSGIAFSPENDQMYAAVGPKGYLSTISIEPLINNPDLHQPGSGSEYIAIGPQDLLLPLQPLLDYYREQGDHVSTISVDAIYDQFNHGIAEPEGIRLFIQYASEHWSPKPKYILLVGDSTYDPKGYANSPELNRLPTFFVMTDYGGQTASDVKFALLDDDQLPDIAVGRIPARDVSQVKIFVDKMMLYYRSGSAESWRGKVLTIADGQEQSFSTDARAFINGLSGLYQAQSYAPEAGVSGANPTITDYFNDGFFIIAYFGHGSLTMWGKDRLFTVDDVADLHNLDFPIVLNFTCLNGLFTHPKVVSMSEVFLFQANGGAVAVLGPTSLTLPADQSALSLPLAENLADRTLPSLGEALLSAQRKVPVDQPGAKDVMLTFLLFGDPGLRLFGK